MPSDPRVRVAVVGLGRMGRFHADSLWGRVPGASLCAVVDADEASAAEAGGRLKVPSYTDLASALGDARPDAVVLATPAPSHEALVGELVRAGLPVLCEKPLAATAEGAQRILEAVERAGAVLQIGFQRRFDAGCSAMAQKVAGGGVGEVVLFKSSSRDPGLPTVEYLHSCGGIFVDQLIHDIDLLRFITGDEVTEVTAFGGSYFEPSLDAVGDADTVTVTCRLARGGLAVLDCSRQTGYGYEIAAEVFGTRATVRLQEKVDQDIRMYGDGQVVWTVPYFFAERFGPAFERELLAFTECVRSGVAPRPDARDGLSALRVAEAAGASLRARSAVPVRG